ncbi:Der GTPase-activating protein YihI [Photobacterium galatheae]|uniref:Der GTPase-activating protein YihI n=1 Tax=Photobacterium galatheae TaxID=1654360 RepID=A0A066RNW9_9GAMM|nr:Der GTPase-activating protein YihI [Photobacterium galatheae]KDM92140.1 aminotransferase [Photobacterium galatheae]MCM0150987.1 GTPase-activating protein [Photobacterium galatheae]
MTRKKRSRKPGSEGPAQYVEKSVSQMDLDGRTRQKARKRKGLKAGSRHSDGGAEHGSRQGQAKDPRHGSKKPVPLIVEPKPTKQVRRMNAEQELAMLESDPQLMALLDRLDAGEKLGAGLQKQVDQKLDRIEQLMKQLGLYEEDVAADDEIAIGDTRSEEDLLDDFENARWDDFDKE